jgi:hypothetical protein
MKILNLKNTKNLSRAEMRTIVAGFGSDDASLTSNGATVLCNDGDSVPVDNCSEMDAACVGKKGAKICSGGDE